MTEVQEGTWGKEKKGKDEKGVERSEAGTCDRKIRTAQWRHWRGMEGRETFGWHRRCRDWRMEDGRMQGGVRSDEARLEKKELEEYSNPFSAVCVCVCVCVCMVCVRAYVCLRALFKEEEEGALSSRIKIVWLIKDGKLETKTSVFGFWRDRVCHAVDSFLCHTHTLSHSHTHTHTHLSFDHTNCSDSRLAEKV